MKVAYVLDIYPKFSETFIINEIVAMQRKGIDICIFALIKGDKTFLHKKNKEIKSVVYLTKKSGIEKILSHVFAFLKNPIGCVFPQ